MPKTESPQAPENKASRIDLRGRLSELAPSAQLGDRIKRLGSSQGRAVAPSLEEIRSRLTDHFPHRSSSADGRLPKVDGLNSHATRSSPATRDAEIRLPHGDLGLFGRGLAEGVRNRSTMKVLPSKHLAVVDGKLKLDRTSFLERIQKGHVEHLTRGPIGRDLRLGDQFNLYAKGDVARRLGLHSHLDNAVGAPKATHAPDLHAHGAAGHRSGHFPVHGRISPHYTSHCFHFNYSCGPKWYPRHCWYPRWDPWVHWSWHHRCQPVWDPRPIWCRPVIYEPSPVWVWYESPIWMPLPVVTSGTWVDVPPIIVKMQTHDLQLLAVRFVDPGHPDEGLGPRYRVWFRNNSESAVTLPFDVVLVASVGPELEPGLPQAGVRVTSMEAGGVQSVDIRLPIEVTAMGQDNQGRPTAFDTLHVLVDARRELLETDEANNGARLPVVDILPVDPAVFELDPQAAVAGGQLVVAGEGFGPEPGRVLLHLGGIEMEPEILGWYDLGIRLALPALPLAGPTEAELIVVRGDGTAANPIQLAITPTQ